MYGNIISIISKMNIRYVGELREVNEQNQTISLENVRCMGSEGRVGDPLKEIPASDTVYKFIQFRATDVLNVQFENEEAAPKVAQDPAIIEAVQQEDVGKGKQPAVNPPAAPPPAPAPVASATTSSGKGKDQPVYIAKESIATNQGLEKQKFNSVDTDQQQTGNGFQQRRQSGGNYNPRGGYVPRGGRGGYHNNRGGHRGRGRGGYNNQGRAVVIPESDFDFESSNSKLNKDDLAKEFAKLNVQVSSTDGDNGPETREVGGSVGEPVNGAGYSSSKSFFDDISCESKERMEMQEHGLSHEERRSRIYAERQQNFETFGQAQSDQAQLRYQQRFQQGGRGGYNNNRGGYRGRGRGGYNYNQRGGGGFHHSPRGGYNGNSYRGNANYHYRPPHQQQPQQQTADQQQQTI